MTDFEISGGAFPRTSWSRLPDPLTGHSAKDPKLDDPLCNIYHSHLNGNFVETSSLNLIITFDRASFHQSVDKSLICQYYYHCYWLEKLAPNQNSTVSKGFVIPPNSNTFSDWSRTFHVSLVKTHQLPSETTT